MEVSIIVFGDRANVAEAQDYTLVFDVLWHKSQSNFYHAQHDDQHAYQ